MASRRTISEEIYPHEYLWRASTKLVNELCNSDDTGRHHLILPALITTHTAFEAFVNFCGFVLLPTIWSEEKCHFRGKGLEAKLTAIVAEVPGFDWKKGERPYQSIRDLSRFRDIVVHAKVHTSRYDTDPTEAPFDIHWDHPWDAFFTEEAVTRTHHDIYQFSQSLILAMRSVSDHPHIYFDAYQGSLAHATS